MVKCLWRETKGCRCSDTVMEATLDLRLCQKEHRWLWVVMGHGAGVMLVVGHQEQMMSVWGGMERGAAKFDHAALNGMQLETQFWNFPFDIFGPSVTVGSWNIEGETVDEEGLLYRGWILRRPFTERKARPWNTGSPQWVSKTLKQSTQNRAPTKNDWLRILWVRLIVSNLGFPGGSDVKESACNAGDPGSIPGLGSSPGEGNGYPLQYSCLENAMDRGAWWATVHGVAESDTSERLTPGLHFHSFSSAPLSENESYLSVFVTHEGSVPYQGRLGQQPAGRWR